MTKRVLLCCDLDRTLLPNGPQEESPEARPILRRLAARPEVALAYVTGRHKALIRKAIREWELPDPSFAVGDVGTTIFENRAGRWVRWAAWRREIATDWDGRTREDLAALVTGIEEIRPQESEKQNDFKLSFYADEGTERDAVLAKVRERLAPSGVRASLVWSVDETKHRALLDVLPERATKLHAIRFLVRRKGFDEGRTVFAGDSGNDLPALVSEIRAVLVANARDEVRREAVALAAQGGLGERLYLAKGGFLGMNGNYAAGALEGLAHFLPETLRWMEGA